MDPYGLYDSIGIWDRKIFERLCIGYAGHAGEIIGLIQHVLSNELQLASVIN